MDGKWTCDDLRRPKTENILNILLLCFIVLSYLPQACRIHTRRSTLGITHIYVVSGCLFTATQFALILFHESYHHPLVECIADRKIKGFDALGAALGLVQVTVLWLGSTTLFILFLIFPNSASNSFDRDNINHTARNSAHPTRSYRTMMLTLVVLHLCIWVLPIVSICLPRPNKESVTWPHLMVFFLALAFFILIPGAMVMVVAQFSPQIKRILSPGQDVSQSSLSSATLAMQAVGFVLLGISYKTRIGGVSDPFNDDIQPGLSRDVWTQYRMRGWVWVNNMIFGVGQGLLLLLSLWVKYSAGGSGQRNRNIVDECAPLLGEE